MKHIVTSYKQHSWKPKVMNRSLVIDWNSYLHSSWYSALTGRICFLFTWKSSHSSHLHSSSSRRYTGFLGQSFRLLLRGAGSHSITYLCDNITVEKPSKQPCSQAKPAASTAKCSSGVIVLQLLVATIVPTIFLSFLTVMSLVILSPVLWFWGDPLEQLVHLSVL